MSSTPEQSSANMSDKTIQTFDLLKLPIELQRLILQEYFENWTVSLELTDKYRIKGLPQLAILFTNRHLYNEARQLVWTSFSGKMSLMPIFSLESLHRASDQTAITAIETIAMHTQRLNVHEFNLGGLWKIAHCFQQLRHVDIEYLGVGSMKSFVDQLPNVFTLSNIMDGSTDGLLAVMLGTPLIPKVDPFQEKLGDGNVMFSSTSPCEFEIDWFPSTIYVLPGTVLVFIIEIVLHGNRKEARIKKKFFKNRSATVSPRNEWHLPGSLEVADDGTLLVEEYLYDMSDKD